MNIYRPTFRLTIAATVFLGVPWCSTLFAQESETKLQPFAGLSIPKAPLIPLREGEGSPWTEIPEFMRGAAIFQSPFYDGDINTGMLTFTLKEDAVLGLAASWAYDGNPNGGWTSQVKSVEDLAAEGWVERGRMYFKLSDRYILFTRASKAGETFHIRTRKYEPPYIFLPDYIDDPPPLREPTKQTAAVEVPRSEELPIYKRIPKESIPAFLKGGIVFGRRRQGVSVVHIHEDSTVYVGASWVYDGNNQGDWVIERWLKEDFIEHGWKPLMTVPMWVIGEKNTQSHTLFVRHCKAGETFRLRSRKNFAPYVMLPPKE